MAWEPGAEKVAVPPLRAAVPRAVAPSLKVTRPVGVPETSPVEATVAARLTPWPETEGLGLETRLRVVPPVLTVWTKAGDASELKLASPP